VIVGDVGITVHQRKDGVITTVSVTLPAVLSRALRDKGYTRVKVEVVADGILLRPYKGAPAGRVLSEIELPEWGET
jgi:hypothetical protein